MQFLDHIDSAVITSDLYEKLDFYIHSMLRKPAFDDVPN